MVKAKVNINKNKSLFLVSLFRVSLSSPLNPDQENKWNWIVMRNIFSKDMLDIIVEKIIMELGKVT